MADITITITGKTNSGKTTVAQLIKDMLDERGFEDVTVDNMDDDIVKFEDRGVLDQTTDRIRDRTIVIEDNNGLTPLKSAHDQNAPVLGDIDSSDGHVSLIDDDRD